jgi:hypothetical protein
MESCIMWFSQEEADNWPNEVHDNEKTHPTTIT